jgi:hypothetical protein
LGNRYNWVNLIISAKGGALVGDIIIEEVNYKAFVMVMGSLLLLIASASLAVVGIKQSKSSYWVPGIMAGLVFLILFTVSAINSMKVRKLLTITHEGIIDSSSISGIGFISFDEIKEFIIMSVYNKKAIAVIPKKLTVFCPNCPSEEKACQKKLKFGSPAGSDHGRFRKGHGSGGYPVVTE